MGLESTALADAVRRLYAEVAAPGAGGVDLNVLRECIGAEHVVMTSMHDGDTEWRACTQFGQSRSASSASGSPWPTTSR